MFGMTALGNGREGFAGSWVPNPIEMLETLRLDGLAGQREALSVVSNSTLPVNCYVEYTIRRFRIRMNSFSSSTNLTVEQKLVICQERIQYTFRDASILTCALTHSSGAPNRLLSNERLEFLGDAVLGFCVCEWLFAEHPEYLEGELTQIKSVVVSRRCCAKISRRLGLEECLILGKGMQSAAGVPRSLLSDVFESVIAAIYLDGGFEPARKFIIDSLKDELSLALQEHTIGNFKSALQQLAQREHGIAPSYKLIGERGPDHSKQFKIEAEIGSRKFTPAWARNKKEAEQRAAGNALAELRGEAAPYLD